MRVKERLIFSHLLISLLGIVLVFVGITGLNDVKNGVDQINDETIAVQNELANLKLIINTIVIDTTKILFFEHLQAETHASITNDAVINRNKDMLAKELNEWKSNQSRLERSLSEYERLVLKFFPEEKRYLHKIKLSSQAIWQTSEDIINADVSALDYTNILLYSAKLEEAHQQFRQTLQVTLENEERELVKRKEILAQKLNNYRAIMLILSIFGFLLAGIIAYLFSRCTLKSISQLQRAAIELGKGNLDARVENSKRDELGELSQAFDQMAEDLQQAIAYTLNICESLTESLIVLNPASVIQSVNQSTCQLLGYDSEALIGQPGKVVFAETEVDLKALTLDQLVARGAIVNLETNYLTLNGDKICVLFSASVLTDGNGKTLGIVYLAQDMTGLKQAQEKNTLLANALEHVADAIEITDPSATYLYVNAAFETMTGYTSQEVLGQTPAALLHSGQHSPCFYRKMYDTVSIGQIWNGSVVSKRKNGSLYDQEVTLSPILNQEGVLTNIVAVKRDISARQAIERMKDEFVSMVSHELRTPLASIHGGLNLLSSGLMDPHSPKGRRVIEIASENADRLVLLVNDILELDRLESGKIKLLLQPCDAADLIMKAINLIQVMANRTGITIGSDVAQPILLVTDPDRLIQVLTNLLSNAIKFSDWGAKISITVELPSAENFALFMVKDHGRGIPEEHLESIFERFKQIEASDSRKQGGTGLGLAICRSIVEQLGGQIWVKSELGQGSCFYFTIPLNQQEMNAGDEP